MTREFRQMDAAASPRLELADRVDDGSTFDYIVCGAGSSGSVVAGRLAADPNVSVLLIESGGDDDDDRVRDPDLWPANLGTERTWDDVTEPNERLNGRRLAYATGRGLGGGGSINAGVWARGHQSDWNSYAEITGDDAWGYEHVLGHYRDIEDWQGAADPVRRGILGPMRVRSSLDVHPLFTSFLDGAEAVGIPRFDSSNGILMESAFGSAVREENIHDGVRQAPFRRYVADRLGQPNLTVLPHATVSRVVVSGGRARGVEFVHDGTLVRANAEHDVVLSLGALGTPAALMRSGIGDEDDLRALGIPVVQHLPGVGRNLDDHMRLPCMWEATGVPLPMPTRSQAVVFAEDESRPGAPEFVMYLSPAPSVSPESAAQYPPPERCFTLMPAMRLRPESRGRVRLASTDPLIRPRIETNFLADPDDMRSALSAVALAREVGNSAALRPFTAREVSPATSARDVVESFVRNAVETYWHQSGTCRMGLGDGAVVDSRLAVYGVEGLRVADASVLPHVTVANTMAPSIVVGERAAEILIVEQG
ncbi:GMC family oxidoreductase [Microbacterium sp. MPKO10]|uniref:GMC family oxidoreductase n=1 Tax=Microbacterium sp. MPKO10 TaxID=2989818 RepID=UPI0022367FDA|nr:GMC family oxidoreductase N-terminal domain-containing protein [Microbacterium sp. MPKO10]MCW4459924.1 GMC family oxidoreductase N-terminal domain-containing protein [Microbacterium sp. MPKO10]